MRPIALIVDRDADTRRMYADYLEFASWDSEEATDGRAGLVKALTRYHDVISTDTRLSFISGYELCRILKRDRITAAIPIVVVTGDAYESDIRRARLAGADAVLVKPCLPDALVRELNRQLTNDTTMSTTIARVRGQPFAKVTRSPQSCPSCRRTLMYLDCADAPREFGYYICGGDCGTFGYHRHVPRQPGRS
jgi:two-component system cell cycle response regulator DivK